MNNIISVSSGIFKATNLCWEITSRCNDRCAFCYRPAVRRELGTEEANLVLDRLVRGGIRKITWTGGEALLCPGTEELIQRAHAAGVGTSLITNAMLLTEERARRLAPHLDWITFSLDGPDAETQAAMTRNTEHFKRITNWLRRFQGEFPSVRRKVNTVAASPNLLYIPDMVPLINLYGVSRWKIFRFFPVRGAALRNADGFAVGDAEFEEFAARMELCRRMMPKCRMDTQNHADMNNAYLSVLPDGTLRVSHDNRDEILGSLLEKELDALLDSPAFSAEKHMRRTGWLHQTAAATA